VGRNRMIFDFLNLNPEAFGLDISDLSLKLVKLKRRKKKYQIECYGEISLPKGIIKRGEIKKPDDLAEAIKQLIKETKSLKTRYVIASLPEEKSFVQVITMPEMTKEEIKKAVQYEAENYIPFPIDKVYLDSQVVPSVKRERKNLEVLLVALPKTTVDPYLYALKKANLKPIALEVESQSIARALIKNQTSLLPYLLMDIGATRTTFILFGGKSIRFTASIPISSTLFTKAIAKTLRIDFKKAEELKIKYGLKRKRGKGEEVFDALIPILTDLKEQIKRYIEYYHSHVSHEYLPSDGSTVKKVILCGRGANLIGLERFLTEELGVPTKLGNPLVNLSLELKESSIPKGDLLGFTVAIGLALRGIS
jgi:type IV pilus assembly protein PilM